MRLIAHRGGRGFGLDNTIEAMEEAARRGIRAIEIDVRMTADGMLVVCHDPVVWGHVVSRMTYEELRRHSPERPLLRDVLERLAGWVCFDVEVKSASMSALVETLRDYNVARDVLVTSFSAEYLDGLREVYPETRTGYLYRMPYGEERRLEHAMRIGAEVILPHYSLVSEGLVRDAHEYGLEVCPWTVNNERDLDRLAGWGVDAAITDGPQSPSWEKPDADGGATQ